MTMELVVCAIVLWAFYDAIFNNLLLSRKELAGRQRRRNEKRGITMTPGFTYIDPDGTRCMSKTGRARDCTCKGKHESHR